MARGFILEVGDVFPLRPVSMMIASHPFGKHLVHGETPATIWTFLDSMLSYSVHVTGTNTIKCLMTYGAVLWSVSDDCGVTLVACPLHDWFFFRVLSLYSED